MYAVSIAHLNRDRQKGDQQKVLSVGEDKALLVKHAVSIAHLDWDRQKGDQ